MGILIGHYEFDGPYVSAEELEDDACLYIVLCEIADSVMIVLELGDAESGKVWFEGNMHRWRSTKECFAQATVAVYYTKGLSYQQIEKTKKAILSEFHLDELSSCFTQGAAAAR